MKSVRLGKTGLLVSEVGFGGIPIIPLSFDQGVSVVRHCFEQGITFFDLEKCPYNLPIPDLLKENVALFRDYIKQS